MSDYLDRLNAMSPAEVERERLRARMETTRLEIQVYGKAVTYPELAVTARADSVERPTMKAIVTKDRTGREIITYEGTDMGVWMNQFKSAAYLQTALGPDLALNRKRHDEAMTRIEASMQGGKQ
ncbi:hypothetical protein ACFQ3P_13800 [Paraburkholderia sabiae]|uniref:Phage protein, HK97 gp10 family n=1 Tax=Paraburkholderia sabiae TaxID=273251 RepID=A0ABU9QD74_9BURK|nr:hypothetical protein [Paraburkholderia sabiae]WJZ76173.1 hypothetical protein QEN71_10340 [Paraburkholderia sabiae]CAD6525944.1 hypothetical protein LMG24235_01901 [Paraburkholderia sabiae]